jgi:hypothetical protein
MRKKSNKKIDIVCMESVNGEEDLKPRPGINLNPPPDDGRCECCGKHISELKPFGKAGDPVNGDFDGAYLVKTFRSPGRYNEEAMQAMKEAEDQAPEDPREWLCAKYGDQIGDAYYFNASACSCVDKSWECRDCIVLSGEEYFEKRRFRES